jgi:hypothetical protein
MTLIFAVNPILEVGGQIAAIVICIFALVFILIAAVLHLAMSYLFTWLREKSELVKKLRPLVNNVNKTTEAAVPRVHTLDRRVGQATNRVAHAAIEVRARTVQVQAIVKTFLLPGLITRQKSASKGPGSQRLTEEKKDDES